MGRPVAVIALHAQLAPLAWAFSSQAPGMRLGYVQTEGGALPGGHSRTVRELRRRGLLAGHITAGGAFGGEAEAITTGGAIHHGLSRLGWDAVVCGPGPGIVGSASALGHGGMAALDSAHVSLALGCPTLVVARMSSSDQPRTPSRDLPPHAHGPRPAAGAGDGGAARRHALPGRQRPRAPGWGPCSGTRPPRRAGLALDVERPARITRHDWRRAAVDLPGFAATGLPSVTMGRELAEDPLFFASALAGGGALSELAREACAPAGTL